MGNSSDGLSAGVTNPRELITDARRSEAGLAAGSIAATSGGSAGGDDGAMDSSGWVGVRGLAGVTSFDTLLDIGTGVCRLIKIAIATAAAAASAMNHGLRWR